MPSTVWIERPSHATPIVRHDSTGSPSMSTAQAPHSPSSQPCLVPVRLRSSRITSSSVLYGAKATCDLLAVHAQPDEHMVVAGVAHDVLLLGRPGIRAETADEIVRDGLRNGGGGPLAVGPEPHGGPVERAEHRAGEDARRRRARTRRSSCRRRRWRAGRARSGRAWRRCGGGAGPAGRRWRRGRRRPRLRRAARRRARGARGAGAPAPWPGFGPRPSAASIRSSDRSWQK